MSEVVRHGSQGNSREKEVTCIECRCVFKFTPAEVSKGRFIPKSWTDVDGHEVHPLAEERDVVSCPECGKKNRADK